MSTTTVRPAVPQARRPVPARPYDRQEGSTLSSDHDTRLPPSGALLSPLEHELLAGLAAGLSMEAVARRSGLSPRTLRRHMRVLCDRIGARSPTQAVAWAARQGLV